MSRQKAVALGLAWAVSLIGVGVWAQTPTGVPHGGKFGMVYNLGDGLMVRWQGHADAIEGEAGPGHVQTFRGNVSISLPDASASHFVLLADEVVWEPGPAKNSGAPTFGEELRLAGNVRLKVVRP